MAGIYIGDKPTITAGDVVAGTYIVLVQNSVGDVRNITYAEFSTLFSALPVADTVSIVKGSADATKLLRFEVDGFTTGTTRVLTPPNANATIAGLEVAQTFTAAQTITPTGGGVGLTLGNGTTGSSLTIKVQEDTQYEAITIEDGTNANLNANLELWTTGGTEVRLSRYGAAGSFAFVHLNASGVYLAGGADTTSLVGASSGNLFVGGALSDEIAVGKGVVVIRSGTPPTAFPADAVQTWSADYAAGDARLRLRTETDTNGLWLGNNAVESAAPSANAGNSLSLVASSAATGNTNGGSVFLRPGLRAGSGIDGRVKIRQPGGMVDVHQLDLYHDGTDAFIEVPTTSSKLRLVPNTQVIVPNSGSPSAPSIGFAGNTDLGMYRSGTNTARLCANSVDVLQWGQNAINLHVSCILAWGSSGVSSDDLSFARAAAGLMRIAGSSSTTPAGIHAPPRSPSQITADQNNYNPGVGLTQRWSSDASRNVTGMVAGQDGEVRYIWNVGAQNIVLQNANGGSTAANQFLTATGADLTIAANGCALVTYDATTARWRAVLLS